MNQVKNCYDYDYNIKQIEKLKRTRKTNGVALAKLTMARSMLHMAPTEFEQNTKTTDPETIIPYELIEKREDAIGMQPDPSEANDVHGRFAYEAFSKVCNTNLFREYNYCGECALFFSSNVRLLYGMMIPIKYTETLAPLLDQTSDTVQNLYNNDFILKYFYHLQINDTDKESLENISHLPQEAFESLSEIKTFNKALEYINTPFITRLQYHEPLIKQALKIYNGGRDETKLAIQNNSKNSEKERDYKLKLLDIIFPVFNNVIQPKEPNFKKLDTLEKKIYLMSQSTEYAEIIQSYLNSAGVGTIPIDIYKISERALELYEKV